MKLKSFLATFAMLLLIVGGITFTSCSSDDNDDKISGGEQSKYVRIHYKTSDTNVRAWIWDDFDPSEVAKCKTWPNGIPLDNTDGEFKYADIQLLTDKNGNITAQKTSMLIIDANGTKLTGDIDITFNFPKKYTNLYFKKGDNTVYVDKDFLSVANGLQSAVVTGERTIECTFSGTATPAKEMFNVVALGESMEFTMGDISSGGKLVLTMKNDVKQYSSITVTYTDASGIPDIATATPTEELIDEWYGNANLSNAGYKDGVFTTWAPFATSAEVLLFLDQDAVNANRVAETVPLSKQENGIWTSSDVSGTVGGNKFYKYRFVNNGKTYEVADIWAKVASRESEASAINAIPAWSEESEYKNPWSGSDYTDAIIYEMHIRDWSTAFNPSSIGKFKEIAAAMAKPDGELYKHLSDLGVTHVQILPMFEWAVYNKERTDNTEYNWGYNPYNYNVPESRYVESNATEELRAMVKAFHDAGISVIMDVVYNHTSGTGEGSLYDMTVPEYFYRMKNGSYSNGSGCGNEVATNHKVVKQYVIESLKHWMNDYHINGFRFDLMGVHESETMKEIYDELYKIDSKVMVYGEPWTGGDSAVVGSADKATAGTSGMGAGAFDDDFRDSIKGAEFGGFKKGQVQGTYSDSGIIKGLTGATTKRNDTGMPGLSLHYVECHDNYTLFDKLAYSTVSGISGDDIVSKFPATLTEEQLALIKKQDKLAAAYIFLAQGTPFINGGQEFMRTKQGNPDSYAADTKGGKTWTEAEVNKCNTVDLSFKTKYIDVYNTYKGLIALRKANSAAFGKNASAKAETLEKGVTKYTTGEFLVYFNATDETVDITTTGYTKAVDVSSGTPTESATLPATVAAKSFVILKK